MQHRGRPDHLPGTRWSLARFPPVSCPDRAALSPCITALGSLPPAWTRAGWLQHRTASPLPCWGGLQDTAQPRELSASAPALWFLALSTHHELRSWFSMALGNGAETCSRSGGEEGLLETVLAGHAWPRGAATQGWHPVLMLLAGFPWQQQGTLSPLPAREDAAA